MRRRRIAFRWSGIAIVTAQFLLALRGAHCGIDLDLSIELQGVDFGKVFDKITGPGTAIAARGIETAFNLQRLALFDRHERARGLERFQFGIVLNAWQIDAVYFFVLPDQRIVRRTEHWVPEQAAKASEAKRSQDPVVMVDAVQGKALCWRDDRKENRKHDQRTRRFGSFQSSGYESSRH